MIIILNHNTLEPDGQIMAQSKLPGEIPKLDESFEVKIFMHHNDFNKYWYGNHLELTIHKYLFTIFQL